MSGPDIGGHRRTFRANRRPPACARPVSGLLVRLRCCRRGAHPGAIEAETERIGGEAEEIRRGLIVKRVPRIQRQPFVAGEQRVHITEKRPLEGDGHCDEQNERDRCEERSQTQVDRIFDPHEGLQDRFAPGLHGQPWPFVAYLSRVLPFELSRRCDGRSGAPVAICPLGLAHSWENRATRCLWATVTALVLSGSCLSLERVDTLQGSNGSPACGGTATLTRRLPSQEQIRSQPGGRAMDESYERRGFRS